MLKRKIFSIKVVATFVLASLGFLFAFTACSSSYGNDYDVEAAYRRAVEDAVTAEPGEISRDLTAIVPWEPGLIWEGIPGESRVLVVTWTSSTYYDNQAGNDAYWLPEGANVWVTAAPQLKNFLAEERGNQWFFPTLRAEQVLGLPPDSGYDKFVEIWVDPADLFRPAPDPEITDHEAGLSFPDKNSMFLIFNDAAIIKERIGGVDGSYTYKEWFEALKAHSYTGEHPYPWTRLGYTYDWGGDDEFGLSEFIIRGGAYIGIKAVIQNDDYLSSSPFQQDLRPKSE